jgi:hypothetical protein
MRAAKLEELKAEMMCMIDSHEQAVASRDAMIQVQIASPMHCCAHSPGSSMTLVCISANSAHHPCT